MLFITYHLWFYILQYYLLFICYTRLWHVTVAKLRLSRSLHFVVAPYFTALPPPLSSPLPFTQLYFEIHTRTLLLYIHAYIHSYLSTHTILTNIYIYTCADIFTWTPSILPDYVPCRVVHHPSTSKTLHIYILNAYMYTRVYKCPSTTRTPLLCM